jgi:hypothetical protein
VSPLRLGRFLIAPDDSVALEHLFEHHWPVRGRAEHLRRWAALAALSKGLSPIAEATAVRHYGRKEAGPLEVEAVWIAVREALKSCGLTGVRIRVHRLSDAGAGLGDGAVMVGFSRRGNALEARQPVVVVKVRPEGTGRCDVGQEARALAEVRRPLPTPSRALIPIPLTHHVAEGFEVLAMGFLPGRPMPLDLVGGRGPKGERGRRIATVAATLATMQGEWGALAEEVEDGSGWPEELTRFPWSGPLRERLAVRPIPLLPAHGAFSPANVLFAGDRVSGIMDWSSHRPRDLPTRDLFDFLVGAARLGDRTRRSDAEIVRRAFVQRTPISRSIRQALLRYGERRELGLPTLHALFRLHLVAGGGGDPAIGGLGSREERLGALGMLDTATETVFTP